MKKEASLKDIRTLQVWYRISGFCFGLLVLLALLLFFSINQSIIDETRYIIIVITTVMYVFIPFTTNISLSLSSTGPMLLEEINNRRNRFRWIEYFFSSTLMIIAITILTGMSSYLMITYIALMNILVFALGAISDSLQIPWRKGVVFFLASALFVYYWFIIIIESYIVENGGDISSVLEDTMFAQLFVILFLFSTFPLVFLIQHFSGLVIKYVTLDKFYILSGFITKAALFVITLLRF
jgi:hypothetical protein